MNEKPHFELNEITKKLPKHLHKFIVKQPYDDYTYQNQAVWRYVMKRNTNYLSKVAHISYMEGLEKTGISLDYIPKMEGMNRILKEIGWAAVSVDGFIPPNAFMEFQAYNVLVIASEMRTIDHIEYTPAPDIIHESAGHAPIIANPEYSEYLRRFGEIGAKAISSSEDYELYEAVRLLSILKENPNSSNNSIKEAQDKVEWLQDNMSEMSEMSQIRNLHWWTVEYGLIGTLDDPKVYGAGLLSSIGESKSCLLDSVTKLPYTIEAATVSFDITKPQPQLFVTPDLANLSSVLEEFAKTMALRKGGFEAVKKLIASKNLGTLELDSGIQVSGIFNNVIKDKLGNPIYIQTIGPTALSYRDKELVGHGVRYHSEGFGSPLSKLKDNDKLIQKMTPLDLANYGIYEGKHVFLEFEGGISVEGVVITGTRNIKGEVILISFDKCIVKCNDEFLFKPEWGVYDMAVGTEIVSGYAGAADISSFEDVGKVSEIKTNKIQYSERDKELNKLYKKVREFREKDIGSNNHVVEIFNVLVKEYPNDWLLSLELYEISKNKNFEILEDIKQYLEKLKLNSNYTDLIENGLKLV